MLHVVKAMLGLVVLFIGLTAPAMAAKLSLSGEVTYLERMALPAGATLKVELVDTALAGAPARVGAEAAIASPGQVPLTFTLNFEDAVLISGHAYALVAEISAGGRLFFRNTEPFAIDPLAPVAPISIILNFAGTTEPIETVPDTPAFLDIVWEAIDIGGIAVLPNATTSLSVTADMRAGGRGGCNSYFAQARIDGTALAFSAVAATRMACAEDVTAQEARFFEALANTRSWHMDGEMLVLSDSTGAPLVRFAQ